LCLRLVLLGFTLADQLTVVGDSADRFLGLALDVLDDAFDGLGRSAVVVSH